MLETVTIEHPDNPGQLMIINKSDFDPAIHRPYEAPETPNEEGGGDQAPKAPKTPKPKAEK